MKTSFSHYEIFSKNASGKWELAGTTKDLANKKSGQKYRPRFNRSK